MAFDEIDTCITGIINLSGRQSNNLVLSTAFRKSEGKLPNTWPNVLHIRNASLKISDPDFLT